MPSYASTRYLKIEPPTGRLQLGDFAKFERERCKIFCLNSDVSGRVSCSLIDRRSTDFLIRLRFTCT